MSDLKVTNPSTVFATIEITVPEGADADGIADKLLAELAEAARRRGVPARQCELPTNEEPTT